MRQRIILQAGHDDLAFGIAEADIVFDDAWAVLVVDHQADEEDAAIGAAILLHADDGGRDDLVHHALLHGCIEDGRGRVGAHAAGVGAGVAIADALVVLRACERHGGLAIAEGEEGGLLAVHELLDDEEAGGRAELAAEHGVDLGFGFGFAFPGMTTPLPAARPSAFST